MQALIQTAESSELPFPQSQPVGKRGERVQEWVLGLRHAQIAFGPDDRLVLLYGHRLAIRLGLHAAAERVLAGEPVVYIDGASTFDPFVIGRLARAHRRQPRAVLSMIHVARAFTGLQMERLISDCLLFALDRYQSRTAILSGVFDTHDSTLSEQDEMRLFGRIMESTRRLAQQGYALLFLCPQLSNSTRTAQRYVDSLRLEANRVIRIREEQGLVRLQQEEAGTVRQSWEIPRTELEIR